MRSLLLGLVAMMATIGVAHADTCAGSGSETVLTFEEWWVVPDSGGTVELTYRLQETRTVTRLQAHVYFESAPGSGEADAALTLENAAGLTPGGSATVRVSKAMAQRLTASAPGNVLAYACTNVMEYLDGSGVIID